MSISIKTAELVLKAAVEKAKQLGVPMNLAVLDEGGHLKAFVRMDGAVLGSIDVAVGKAKSAALFGLNSEELFEFCKPGGPAFGLENTNGGLVVFAGGIPLRNDHGEVIGAVGVSGGSVQEDFSVAQAGVGVYQSSSMGASK
uniref:Heme-binding protein n=1 Tax=uncultured bacterium BLR5 TaxID=506522 RepID=C0INU6_9BACT|nr:hypothetical protein AKSOIL_0019 [uncultured bacterium BLR5]